MNVFIAGLGVMGAAYAKGLSEPGTRCLDGINPVPT